ncbi:MAG: hypothetical protein CL910_06935 [Deltaproteobacteria bacterium]|jgi:hypothetical protein|nr:hypothetical protein [Deltaproteobacteria bacterium]
MRMRVSTVAIRAIAGLALWALAAPAAAGSIYFEGTLTVDILDDLFVIETPSSGHAYLQEGTDVLELNPRQFVVEEVGGTFGPETPREIIPPIVLGAENNYASGRARFAPRADGSFGGPMALLGDFDFLGEDDLVLMNIVLDPIGAGGSATTSFLNGLLNTLTTGLEWTTGTATANDVIVGGIPGQSLSRTGSDHRDPDGFGRLRLVTASEMTIDGSSLGFFVKVPTFATLDLLFLADPPDSGEVVPPSVPEPRLALLVSVSLALLGMRRRPGSPPRGWLSR